MPTMEIISVGATSSPAPPQLTRFAQRHEMGVSSDRWLFEHILNDYQGIIVHLGDPSNIEDPAWFCGHVVQFNDDDDELLKYEESALLELTALMEIMQQASPTNHIIFLTDYQLGPAEIAIEHLGSINEIQNLNSINKLRFNTLYHIKSELP